MNQAAAALKIAHREMQREQQGGRGGDGGSRSGSDDNRTGIAGDGGGSGSGDASVLVAVRLFERALAEAEAIGDAEAALVALANLANVADDHARMGGGDGGGGRGDGSGGDGGGGGGGGSGDGRPAPLDGWRRRAAIRALLGGLGRAPNGTCPVCLDDIDSGDGSDGRYGDGSGSKEVAEAATANAGLLPVRVLRCYHMLHVDCHKQMRDKRCPLCMA